MKIATYNVNGINGHLENLLRWLEEAAPDIVCLQELKCENDKFPAVRLKEAGYNAVWQGQKSWNGVAILARSEIKELRNDLPGSDEEFTHSRYIEAFIDGLVIGCIYLPNGNPFPGPKFDYKLRWFERLAHHAAKLVERELPVILIGDFNVMPTELDTYKPEKYINDALFRVEVREAYKNLVGQGWTDAIRTLYPNDRIYTFWDYFRDAYGRNAGLRIDHFLLNKNIAGRLTAATVDKDVRGWKGVSDHAPVWIGLSDGKPLQRDKNADNTTDLEQQIEAAGEGTAAEQKPAADLETLLKNAPKSKIPGNIKPMKATLVDAPFDDPGWIYEIKWDGYRAIGKVENGKAELISRNNLPFDQFGPVVDELESWKMNVILDGEVVVLNEQGTSDFGALQNWRNSKNAKLSYFVFDILWYEGRNLMGLPLSQRRAILTSILPAGSDLIKPSHAFEANGIEFFEVAKKMKLEGIIAKRADSLYAADARSHQWLKIKAKRRQEVVIAGYTTKEGSVNRFSSLILGVYDSRGTLRYIGKVGTGFTQQKQAEIFAQLKPLVSKSRPFTEPPNERSTGETTTWLRPDLVCEVEFAEFTVDGKVRQASFKGMRIDKNPKDVILETEAPAGEVVEEVDLLADMKEAKTEKTTAGASKVPKSENLKSPEKLLLTSPGDTEEKEINGHLLKFTHLDKLYWPEDGVSKRDMFNYYDQVAPFMVPYLKDRPMSLNRFPDGIHGISFYQKDVRDKAPQWAKTMLHTTDEGEEKQYLVGDDEATLLWMATQGCIEINPWFSRVQSQDNPDYCVIDLDPDNNTFDQVVQAAQTVKNLLDAIAVPCYAKTSGSTGMHIYIPLAAQYSYEQSQLFANIIVRQVQKQLPDYTTLERMLKKRKGKMYLDFLQNRPGATIAGVYSLRPKPGATVSMPVTWDEVKPGLTMRDFTIRNAIGRLREAGDLFSDVLGQGIDLANTIEKAQSVFK